MFCGEVEEDAVSFGQKNSRIVWTARRERPSRVHQRRTTCNRRRLRHRARGSYINQIFVELYKYPLLSQVRCVFPFQQTSEIFAQFFEYSCLGVVHSLRLTFLYYGRHHVLNRWRCMQKCIRASGINTFNAVSGLVSKGLQYACTPSDNRASVVRGKGSKSINGVWHIKRQELRPMGALFLLR